MQYAEGFVPVLNHLFPGVFDTAVFNRPDNKVHLFLIGIPVFDDVN